jgi:hypothetical protein
MLSDSSNVHISKNKRIQAIDYRIMYWLRLHVEGLVSDSEWLQLLERFELEKRIVNAREV